MNWPAIAWIVIAATGVVIQTLLLQDSMETGRLVKISFMRILAKLHTRAAFLRLAVCLGNLLIGVLVVFNPARGPSQPISIVGVLVLIQLILGEFVLVTIGFLEYSTRQTLAAKVAGPKEAK